ncbi:E3 ubiquitin-protein [Vigna angularis]|uniref:RING-type E3 ubiquitin transferase n=1 Tax=Phaseolus angularis TaxID=3914 RepID=A0A8T0JZ48_PHAAN|nr:E3 ubiquitin-protein [Vigna angularis]
MNRSTVYLRKKELLTQTSNKQHLPNMRQNLRQRLQQRQPSIAASTLVDIGREEGGHRKLEEGGHRKFEEGGHRKLEEVWFNGGALRFSFLLSLVARVYVDRISNYSFVNSLLGFFQELEELLKQLGKKQRCDLCLKRRRLTVHQVSGMLDWDFLNNQAHRGYLFEGHLTVDPEPPQPQWLVQSNLLTTAATLFAAESSQASAENGTTQEDAANILQDLINRLEEVVPLMVDEGTVAPRAPPASKEVVAKLPVITLTEEILATLGKDAECAICRENLILNDKMQELPCKHTFHPPCLKPWLDEHNSCPICRYELQTDDHAYESWKEREKEAEEERKGAENAIRGGEYMYV